MQCLSAMQIWFHYLSLISVRCSVEHCCNSLQHLSVRIHWAKRLLIFWRVVANIFVARNNWGVGKHNWGWSFQIQLRNRVILGNQTEELGNIVRKNWGTERSFETKLRKSLPVLLLLLCSCLQQYWILLQFVRNIVFFFSCFPLNRPLGQLSSS